METNHAGHHTSVGDREGLHCLKHSPPPQMDTDLGGAPSCEVLAGRGVGSGSSGRSKASTRGTGGCDTAVRVQQWERPRRGAELRHPQDKTVYLQYLPPKSLLLGWSVSMLVWMVLRRSASSTTRTSTSTTTAEQDVVNDNREIDSNCWEVLTCDDDEEDTTAQRVPPQ